MRCHACSGWLYPDHHGHPVHVGPCPGYPPKPENICGNCGADMPTPGHLRNHGTRCTPEHPNPPRPRDRRCPTCTLYHRPHCAGFAPRWPLDALVARFGIPGTDEARFAAGEALGVHPSKLATHELSGLSDERADDYACRLGLHPSLIWPAWFDGANHPSDAAFLASGWRQAWLADHPDHEPVTEEVAA